MSVVEKTFLGSFMKADYLLHDTYHSTRPARKCTPYGINAKNGGVKACW
ncbi:hypothetical protein [Heyndrickxia shackletonii]|nr:hypothetical protein [Heyndrickxia shackletonii]NEY98791.1 hypothetical protein [Heyndrickxia shackletonii]